MDLSNRSEAIFLFIGDIILFYVSLFFMLFIRYGSGLDGRLTMQHIIPFSILFVLWVVVFFIAGLYEKHTLLLQKQLPQLLLNTLVINSIIAVAFFYFVPALKITPKINLFIYLFVSCLLLLLWRWHSYRLGTMAQKQNAVIIGSGRELAEITNEVNQNPRYRFKFVATIDTDKISGGFLETELLSHVSAQNVGLVAIDLKNAALAPVLPHLYTLLFSKVRFVDMHTVYEDIFDRVPLSLLGYNWFLENISAAFTKTTYDFLKRSMDIAASAILGLLSLFLYPFVVAAIRLDDNGPVFVFQERVGRGNRTIRTIKFRTMARDDAGLPELKAGNRVTRVGSVLRKTRIDELPQLLNVLRGEMSLIGPRPELPSLVEGYERDVPYYNIRHLIKPGLSGWAQLYHKTPPKVDANARATAVKLSYDLFYLKNRSLLLDLKIALKTLKVLLSRSGV